MKTKEKRNLANHLKAALMDVGKEDFDSCNAEVVGAMKILSQEYKRNLEKVDTE